MLGPSRPSITLDIYAGVATDAETQAAAILKFWDGAEWPEGKAMPPLVHTRKARAPTAAAP